MNADPSVFRLFQSGAFPATDLKIAACHCQYRQPDAQIGTLVPHHGVDGVSGADVVGVTAVPASGTVKRCIADAAMMTMSMTTMMAYMMLRCVITRRFAMMPPPRATSFAELNSKRRVWLQGHQ
jgi:hypothetical protein